MLVDPERARGQLEHAGTTYYFCSPVCQARFAAEPARYLAPGYRPAGMGGGLVSLGKPRLMRPPGAPAAAGPAPPHVPAGAPPPSGPRYVCPMDPDVSSPVPGACPKCGMALEPETITLDD